jgi:hypothetical protein
MAATKAAQLADALEGWFGLAEAAALAKEPRSTFDQAVRRGEIEYAVTPLGRLFRIEDVRSWSRRKQEQTP